jgi:hypothetical protein
MRTLVLNESNLVNDGRNSRFRYQFSTSIKFNEGDQVALSNAQIPYSNFNLSSSQYNNTQFNYTHPNTATVYPVVFPDGFYDVDTDMNYYLQQVMIQNGHYLVNSSQQIVFYLKLSTNKNRYKCQLDCFVVPSVLPSGWSNPANFNLTTFGGKCFSFNFLSSNSFQNLIGFNSGSYGGGVSNTSFLGTSVPSPAPVNSYLITIPNLVSQSNINLNTSSAVYAKTPNVSFGSNLIIEPNTFVWINVNSGMYSYIEVVLCSGDDGSQLTLQDPNSLIMLVIKGKDE